MADNTLTAYFNDNLTNLMNFFKTNLNCASLPSGIRHVAAQQNQNSFTMTHTYEFAATQQREGAESRKVTATKTMSAQEPEGIEVVAF
jgi:hypothetical protein